MCAARTRTHMAVKAKEMFARGLQASKADDYREAQEHFPQGTRCGGTCCRYRPFAQPGLATHESSVRQCELMWHNLLPSKSLPKMRPCILLQIHHQASCSRSISRGGG